MIRTSAIAAVFGLTFASAAHAADLQPVQAHSIDLGNHSGIAYYTIENDGFRVVATLAEGEAGTPVRVEATLAPDQKIILSVARSHGQAPAKVQISRENGQVLVRDAALVN
ncbi:MAG TPA: hypothetical protein VD978_19935 [Azospirillum sp.]|nr:hypothetical protein [Azospirillum sp.]